MTFSLADEEAKAIAADHPDAYEEFGAMGNHGLLRRFIQNWFPQTA